MKKLLFVILIFCFSCKKEPPPTQQPPVFSSGYKEAHYFDFNGNMIRLKEKYLPHYQKGVPYEQWNFEKINEKGYLYTSLKDTPWVVPTFISFIVNFNRVQTYVSQHAFYKDTSYYVYDVYVKYKMSNINYETFYYARYLINKKNPNDKKFVLGDINNNPNYKTTINGLFFGDFSSDNKIINFEYIKSKYSFGSAIGKWQVELFGEDNISKRIENIEFQWIE
jgi:hypothetical protein